MNDANQTAAGREPFSARTARFVRNLSVRTKFLFILLLPPRWSALRPWPRC